MTQTIPTAGGFIRADDRQVSGQHYKTMTVQPWTAMEALLTRDEFIGFLKGSIIKYSMRQGRKDGSDDGAKAQHYIQKLGEVMSGVKHETKEQISNQQLRSMLDKAGLTHPGRIMSKGEWDASQRIQEGWCNGK